MQGNWKFKSCPRCHGDLCLTTTRSRRGKVPVWNCLQCGYENRARVVVTHHNGHTLVKAVR